MKDVANAEETVNIRVAKHVFRDQFNLSSQHAPFPCRNSDEAIPQLSIRPQLEAWKVQCLHMNWNELGAQWNFQFCNGKRNERNIMTSAVKWFNEKRKSEKRTNETKRLEEECERCRRQAERLYDQKCFSKKWYTFRWCYSHVVMNEIVGCAEWQTMTNYYENGSAGISTRHTLHDLRNFVKLSDHAN